MIPLIGFLRRNKIHNKCSESIHVPPHVGTSFNHSNVLDRTMFVVLLPILSDKTSHAILEIKRYHVLRYVEVSDIGQGKTLAEELPSGIGDVVVLSQIQTPNLLLLQQVNQLVNLLIAKGTSQILSIQGLKADE